VLFSSQISPALSCGFSDDVSEGCGSRGPHSGDIPGPNIRCENASGLLHRMQHTLAALPLKSQPKKDTHSGEEGAEREF